MGYLILLAMRLFFVYVVVWLVTAAFMWFGVPVLLVVLPASTLGGAVLAFVVIVLTLAGVGSFRPKTITPDDVLAGTARLPKLRGNNPFGRDPAWPSYLVAQWRVDLSTAWQRIVGILRTVARRINAFGDGRTPFALRLFGVFFVVLFWLAVSGRQVLTAAVLLLLCWGVWRRINAFGYRTAPFALRLSGVLFVVLFWLALSLGAVTAAAVLLLLCWVSRTVSWLGWLAVVGLMRGGDFLIRRARRARGSCPHCYHVSSLPTFRCDGCQRAHHDIRPGRLGGLWRRCACGTRLPTTVLRAASRLPARCPRCDRQLRTGAAVLTDIRLPVFGPVFAGKTRLVYAGLLALRDAGAAKGAQLDFVDSESRTAFQDGAEIIANGGNTVKTPAGMLPRAITVRVTVARRKALLHLFDAAGEFYVDREDNSDLEFLDHAQGLVFVVDPFSVPWVRDQIGDANAASVVRVSPAAEDPDTSYQVTARRLRDYGVDTRRRGLAITVVKADLLAGLPPAEGLRPDQVREWLIQAGMDNLVLSAERDFGEVRYFLVASVSATQAGTDRSPANPFNWLIARAGVTL